jgi:O-methyltransferase
VKLKINKDAEFRQEGDIFTAIIPGCQDMALPRDIMRLINSFRVARLAAGVQVAPDSTVADLDKVINRLRDLVILVPDDDLITPWPMPMDLLEESDDTFRTIRRAVIGHTMGRPVQGYAVYEAVKYICNADIEGAIVETGVWRGGNIALAAMTLMKMQDTSRKLYLFDTFDWSWPDLTAVDTTCQARSFEKRNTAFQARKNLPQERLDAELVSEARVLEFVRTSGYPQDKFIACKGLVQETIPAQAPEKIALLRLDTDLYESTYHELSHLYPRLVSGGILLVDDYPTEHGVIRAVEQYFDEIGHRPFFSRIDIQGRIAVKP